MGSKSGNDVGSDGAGSSIPPPERVWTAALVIIGDEILSGRTRDANLNYLANWLNDQGIRLHEARVVADDMQAIGEAVNACLATCDYVFTTGGIGPTHDDITVEAVAAARGVPVITHPEALAILERHFGAQLTDARRLMARTPEGAELIDNPETGAPGIRLGRLFILAGVPKIARGMLRGLEGKLEGGRPVLSRTIGAWTRESEVAALLAEVQKSHDGVRIGSYPFWRDGQAGANFVLRATDETRLEAATHALAERLAAAGITPHEGEI